MVRVVVESARGTLNKDALRILYDYPHPNTFLNLGLVTAPPNGLYLANCAIDPEMYSNPNPYISHGWDMETEKD